MIYFSKVSSIFRIIILLSLCCQVQQVRCQIKPMGQKGKVRAVVIGISDYQNEHIPDLLFADADAKAFAEFLKSPAGGNLPEDQVKLLTNSQATQGQMNAELTWLLEESKEGDQALIFFSGHGDMETQTMMNLGFLLTYNSPASAYMSGGAFPIYFLQSIIQTLSVQKGVQVIMVADACHSGKLAGDDVEGLAGVALGLGLADADDGKEPGPPDRLGLGANIGIVLAVIGAALRVPDDNGAGAGIGQHLGGDVAGVGAGDLRVAVLGANRDPGARRRRSSGLDNGRRRANHDVDLGLQGVTIAFGHGGDLAERTVQTVHLPVSRHQRLDVG